MSIFITTYAEQAMNLWYYDFKWRSLLYDVHYKNSTASELNPLREKMAKK